MKKKTLFVLTLLAVAMLASGCGLGSTVGRNAGDRMAEKAIERETGGKADVNTSDGKVSVKTQEGETQYSAEGDVKLPQGFPEELVMADDAKIIISNSSASGDSIAYTTQSDQSELFEKYKSGLAEKGWKQVSVVDIGTAKMGSFSKEKVSANITIGENSSKENAGKTLVNIVLIKEAEPVSN
jgi:hypothetical protein